MSQFRSSSVNLPLLHGADEKFSGVNTNEGRGAVASSKTRGGCAKEDAEEVKPLTTKRRWSRSFVVVLVFFAMCGFQAFMSGWESLSHRGIVLSEQSDPSPTVDAVVFIVIGDLASGVFFFL